MQELLRKIAARLESGSYVNEAAVRLGIIEPILASLGWDTIDPAMVIPEYSSEGRRVDYALCAFPARPTVFIEAKAVGKVEAADRQLFEYAFHEGVPFAILTDGRSWSFYLPSAQGSYEDRRLHKLDLQERAPEECQRIFNRYLAFGRLRSGEAQSDAQKDYASRANERVASDTLSRAWSEILSEPDPLLIELLVERTEGLCGIRPALEGAEAFLLGRTRGESASRFQPEAPTARALAPSPLPQAPRTYDDAAPPSTSRKSAVSEGRVPSPRFPPPGPQPSIASGSVIAEFRGQELKVKDATAGFLALLRAIAKEFPERMEQIATAAKGRKRNHISRRREDVYPDSATQLHTVVELIPGWFVGTNIANREKYRIVRAACEACGIRFGAEVRFELPNT